MTFELVTEKNIDIAAEIHSISWKDSHRTFCSEEFVQAHTKERQKQYIEKEMECGKQFYIIKAKNLYLKMGYKFTGNTKTLNSELQELEMVRLH